VSEMRAVKAFLMDDIDISSHKAQNSNGFVPSNLIGSQGGRP
jgi:hypothetical protein